PCRPAPRPAGRQCHRPGRLPEHGPPPAKQPARPLRLLPARGLRGVPAGPPPRDRSARGYRLAGSPVRRADRAPRLPALRPAPARGEGRTAKDAYRLAGEIEGRRLLGLPVRVASDLESPVAPAPALYLDVILTASGPGQTRGQVVVRHAIGQGAWATLGHTPF